MPQSPTLRRLMRESRELSPNPPSLIVPNPTFHAGPLSSNLHEWHFTLLGSPSTPYAGGIYHGRIVLPPTYPLRPPSFRFLTPSGRFEVNREICLSISGFHEESWQPAWGVRLALTALRVFMTEEGKGQIGGLEASEEVRKQLAQRSRRWACSGCETGGKTNEEIMKEWWQCCKEKGVQVGDDGEVIEGTGGQPDEIPEELKLGYRDELGQGQADDNQAGTSRQSSSKEDSLPEPTLTAAAEEQRQPETLEDGAPPTINTSPSPPNPQPSIPQPARNPPSEVQGASAYTSRVPLEPASAAGQDSRNPQPRQRTAPRTPSSAQPIQTQQQRRNGAGLELEHASTPYLDKAISGVIIALFLMVLKKIFV